MKPLAAFVVALTVLAGCAAPPGPPADAVEARSDVVEGLVLRAWTEPTDEGLLLRGELANEGDRPLEYRTECGQPWNSTLRDADGRTVRPFVRDPCSDFFYDFLTPGSSLEFRQSWDLADHEPGDPHGERVAGGTYTWTLEAGVVRPVAETLRTVTPVVVPSVDAKVGFSGEALRADRDHYRVQGQVFNTGDVPVHYNALCGAFDIHVEHANGTRMSAPQAHCQAEDRTVLPPDGTVDYAGAWDRTTLHDDTPGAAPVGLYEWVVRFHAEELDAEHRIGFAVHDK